MTMLPVEYVYLFLGSYAIAIVALCYAVLNRKNK